MNNHRTPSLPKDNGYGVCVAALLTAFFLLLMPGSWTAYLSAGIVLVGGLPHGASDTALASRSWPEFAGRHWRTIFIALYLLTVAAVFLVWWLVPTAGLTGFIALSAWHFGRDDARVFSDSGWLEPLVRGGLPVTAPALLYTKQVGDLFAVLTGPSHTEFAYGLAGVLSVLSLPLLLLAAVYIVQHKERPRSGGTSSLFVTALVLTAFPPLIGFAVYFAFIHGWPQLELRRRSIGIGSRWSFWMRCWPYIVGGFVVVLVFGLSGAERSSTLSFALFAGLAALTVPHCFLPNLPTRFSLPLSASVRRTRCQT